MAHLVKSTTDFLPIFFNVDANVGRNCPNRPEDVELVTHLFIRWAPLPSVGPHGKGMLAKITPGKADEALFASIDELQRQVGGTRDGHISRATAGTAYSPSSPFLICRLNYMVASGYPEQWPRIDKIGAPRGAITVLVKRVLLAN